MAGIFFCGVKVRFFKARGQEGRRAGSKGERKKLKGFSKCDEYPHI